MTKKLSSTKWVGTYISEKRIFNPDRFFIERINKKTVYIGSTVNLLEHKAKGFDMDRIRMAIIRAKQDYGKVFEKLAAED